MLFRKVVLENYGLYAGKVIFDLTPKSQNSQKRPIILFGGKNGAGKTTFLEALKVVLYGKNAFGKKITQKDYSNHLKGKIHKGGQNNSTLPEITRIAIEFDYVTLGEITTYYVERSWKAKHDCEDIDENLQILVNGVPEENVTDDYWKGFIESIIPEKLAQLFFFDGEKIQDIANDETGNKVLADSIKSLLGLDIVEKLKADLTIYKNKELKGSSIANDKKLWDQTEKEIISLKENIDIYLSEKLPHLRTLLNGKLAEIKNREDELHKEGNLFATRQDSLKSLKTKISSRVENLEAEIREECEKSFPFSLCPSISSLLTQQLIVEKKLKRNTIIQDEITSFTNELIHATQTSPNLDSQNQDTIKNLIQNIAKSKTTLSPDLENATILLNLAETTSEQIQATLNYAQKTSKPKVNLLCNELQEATEQLRNITIEIGKIPEDEQLKPIFDELAVLHREFGALQQKEEQLHKHINTLNNDLKIKQKQLDKIIERQTSKSRLELVDQVQDVLNEYLHKLTVHKTTQLQKSVAEAFNSLSRKGNVIEKVKIDPDNFSVTLYDHIGNAIPKNNLSSGEKQLYAIAILWGLAKTSGRPLPIIVDTPLGRLDSSHRINLVTNYFPKASHQVILLSTDTEIDQKLFHEIKDHVSHSFQLNYNLKLKATKVTAKYFWS